MLSAARCTSLAATGMPARKHDCSFCDDRLGLHLSDEIGTFNLQQKHAPWQRNTTKVIPWESHAAIFRDIYHTKTLQDISELCEKLRLNNAISEATLSRGIVCT